MSKRCTTCGDGLTFWDRVHGRFDHPQCWERGVVKLLAINNHPSVRSPKPNALLKLAQFFSRSARPHR